MLVEVIAPEDKNPTRYPPIRRIRGPGPFEPRPNPSTQPITEPKPNTVKEKEIPEVVIIISPDPNKRRRK